MQVKPFEDQDHSWLEDACAVNRQTPAQVNRPNGQCAGVQTAGRRQGMLADASQPLAERTTTDGTSS